MSAIMASVSIVKKSQEARERARARLRAARKESTAAQPNFNPTPPISSAKTAVWHWILDGIPTTVMLNKESSEVWCNGVVLDTIDGFVEDDGDAGGVVDFCIYIEETQSTHKARVKRCVNPDSRYGIVYDLFVDGYQIDEHMGNGQQYQEQYTEQYQPPQYGGGQAGYEQQQGGGYDQAYAGGYDQQGYDQSGYEQSGYQEGYDQNGYAGYDYPQDGAGALPNYGDGMTEAPPSYEDSVHKK